MFKFSNRSISRMSGVHPLLVGVVVRALSLSRVDFGVSEGVRTLARQKQLRADGFSKTLKSKHLIDEKSGFGHAIDLYPSGYSSVKEIPVDKYFNVADAMSNAAREVGVMLQWGAAWGYPLPLFDPFKGHSEYVRKKEGANEIPFLDYPHFEIVI